MTTATVPEAAVATSLIERHYTALRENRLLAHRCTACAAWTVPITTACGACGSGEYEEITLKGTGTLHYAAHNIAPAPHPRFAALAPYVFGHVILDEGVPVQGIVKGIEPTPEATRARFEAGPAAVVLDVLETADLPVIAFRFG
jgi:uncharacterized OB-fold protein